MQNIHNVERKIIPTVKCPLCDVTVQTVVILEKHLVENHEVKLESGELDFDSIEGDYIFSSVFSHF